jgi:hypothetical protein
MGMLKQVLSWVAIGMATSPIWGAFLWELWEGGIRPRLVSTSEIDALAASMIARHGDRAEEMAFVEEDRTWRYSESFEQGKWRRVRRRIERMRRDVHPSLNTRGHHPYG